MNEQLRKQAAERQSLCGLYYGVLANGRPIFPDGGVRVRTNDAGEITCAIFEMDDTSTADPNLKRHKWRYTIPVTSIDRLIDDLGPLEEAVAQ